MPTKTTDDKILCQTPTPGKKGTRIDRWKYDAVRKALLSAVPKRKDGIAAADLPGLVEAKLPAAKRRDLGSVTWYTVTVKLHMETIGELERIAGSRPQRVRRVK